MVLVGAGCIRPLRVPPHHPAGISARTDHHVTTDGPSIPAWFMPRCPSYPRVQAARRQPSAPFDSDGRAGYIRPLRIPPPHHQQSRSMRRGGTCAEQTEKGHSCLCPLGLRVVGSGGWIRTNGLRVMSPTSFHCSTPRRASPHYHCLYVLCPT